MSVVWIGAERTELDSRVEGSDLFTATASSVTSHYFNFTHDCEFNGIEIYAWDSHRGDNVTLYVEYFNGVSWMRYKKFGKQYNVYPEVDRIIMFPATPNAGTRIRVDYDNKGGTDVEFSLNVFKFAVQEKVNPLLGEQGEDW